MPKKKRIYTEEERAVMVEIGQNIRKFRLGKTWTQRELAIMAFNYPSDSKSKNAASKKIYALEHGVREQRITELIAIAKALKINLKDLF